MKKIATFILVFILGTALVAQMPSRVKVTEIYGDNWNAIFVYVYEIDGHEYIWLRERGKGGIIHKEDCKNPCHNF